MERDEDESNLPESVEEEEDVGQLFSLKHFNLHHVQEESHVEPILVGRHPGVPDFVGGSVFFELSYGVRKGKDGIWILLQEEVSSRAPHNVQFWMVLGTPVLVGIVVDELVDHWREELLLVVVRRRRVPLSSIEILKWMEEQALLIPSVGFKESSF